MNALLVMVIGVLEFLGFTWLLKYSFTAFLNGEVAMLSCGILIAVIMWLGYKIENLTKAI